jgi:endogenous inhibitor of DNA gyrase (YacG/DUF329 family)
VSAYQATCPVCGREYTTYYAEHRPWCSVGCQYDRPVKRSALRTWLRRERAREYYARYHHGRFFVCYGPGEICAGKPFEGMREPRADIHIHGRDCDMNTNLCGTVGVTCCRLPATCGVEGDYP